MYVTLNRRHKLIELNEREQNSNCRHCQNNNVKTIVPSKRDEAVRAIELSTIQWMSLRKPVFETVKTDFVSIDNNIHSLRTDDCSDNDQTIIFH